MSALQWAPPGHEPECTPALTLNGEGGIRM